MNIEPNRTCPFCAETIKAAAKLCPRCRQWLTMRSFRHPVVLMCMVFIPSLAVLITTGMAFVAQFDRLFNPKPYYSEFLDSLRIVDSRMNWVQTTDGLRIYLVGIITNQSQVAWKDVEFECRFFDTKGVMVDAANANGNLTIQPNDDSAFRAIVKPGRSTNDYVSHKLSVSSARNSKALF